MRNDADALYHLFKIDVRGAYDLQILELAVRHSLRRGTDYLNGLSRSIETYVKPRQDWKKVKDAGVQLFSPKLGGSYKVFESRPLDSRIMAYCAQDVTLLFELERVLRKSMGPYGSNWEAKIVQESKARVALAKGKYIGQGQHRAISPLLWDSSFAQSITLSSFKSSYVFHKIVLQFT